MQCNADDRKIEKWIGDREDIYHKNAIEERVAEGVQPLPEENPFEVEKRVRKSLGNLEKFKGMCGACCCCWLQQHAVIIHHHSLFV